MGFEPSGYRMKLSSMNGVVHDYGILTQTVSGSVGTHTLTASASIATASCVIGSKIHVGASLHEYTVDSIADPVITTVEPLLQNYIAGTGLRVDVVETWSGTEGFGSFADQVNGANRPAFVPGIVNGYDAIEFNMGSKALPFASYPQIDNLFAGGGTLVSVLGVDTAGGNGAGRLIERTTSANTLAWNLVTTTAAGGYYRMLFDQTTTGIGGAFSTNSVLQLGVPQIFGITYNSSTPTVPPEMYVQGLNVGLNTTSAPTGNAISDTGGSCIIGNGLAGGRGLDGRVLELYQYTRTLPAYDLQGLFSFLSNKYNSPLFVGAARYYGARPFFYREPIVRPAGKIPLVLCLHGGGGSGLTFIEQLQIVPWIGENVILLFPTATTDAGGVTSWNSGPYHTFNRAPDYKYLPDLIRYHISLGLADPEQIYIIGHSNGGMMGYRLMVENPTMFAGIVALSCDVMIDNPGTYVGKILHFHGALDMNVPLLGGIGINGVPYQPVEPAVKQFVFAYKKFNILQTAGHDLSSVKPAIISEMHTTLQQEITTFILG